MPVDPTAPQPAPPPGPGAFAPGQVMTIFRNRLADDHTDEYYDLLPRIRELALAQPGLVDVKSFTAEDGERVTLVTFADEATQAAWKHQVDHAAAQAIGRNRLYAEYSLQVGTCTRSSSFPS